jgi:hypothetical protein
LIPVFEGVPVLHAWQAQPRAAQAVERWLFYCFICIQKSSFKRQWKDQSESSAHNYHADEFSQLIVKMVGCASTVKI